MINVKMRKPKIPESLKSQVDSIPLEIKDMIVAIILANYKKQAKDADIVKMFIPDTTVWYVEQIQSYGFTIEYED